MAVEPIPTVKMYKTMKMLRTTTALALALAYVAGPVAAFAADKKEAAKPYALDKCIVTDEKLGEMDKPYVFTQDGQEVKLCCKNCLKDFKKDTAKYMKKIKDAEVAKADKK